MPDETSTAVAESKPQAGAPEPPAENSEARYRSRKEFLGSTRAKVALGVLILILLVAGFFAWRYFTSYESTDDAQIDGHVNSVSARVSGHVVKLNVDDNQYVEKGTVLVEIDPADYEVAVALARAVYADAQAQSSASDINVPITSVSTSSQVESAQAGVALPRPVLRQLASSSKRPRRRSHKPKPTM